MRSTSLYIAWRYLFSKKGSTAVTFITGLAALAMTAAVAAMFVIVSVFSGLEDLNRDMIADLHADLTLSGKSGKSIPGLGKVTRALAENPQIAHFSKIIEEKVYVQYNGTGEIAYLRGVDSAYTAVNPVDKGILVGKYPDFKYSNVVLMENQLDNRLAIPVDTDRDVATLLMPKPGKGIISKEDDIFNKKDIYISGVFPGNDQLNNYIIAPLELSEELLNLPKNSAYQIVIKLKNPADAADVKQKLIKTLGDGYDVKTKQEENSAFWKMINTEKLMIYLIFSLVIFITTFNLAGAIIILQLDKKDQAKALISLGFSLQNLRKTYLYTGLLIVLFGILCGLVLGNLLCLLQLHTGAFKASENLPFPVKLQLKNDVLVASVALIFGLSVSYIFSKVKQENITEN